MTLRKSILKTLAVAAFLFAAWPVAHAADKTPEVTDEKKPVTITTVEHKPSFPGGEAAMYKWLGENLKFPSSAVDLPKTIRIVVEFIIKEDGSIGNVKAEYPNFPPLATEIIRVVSMMPKWEPGHISGFPTCVRYELPITFKLKR